MPQSLTEKITYHSNGSVRKSSRCFRVRREVEAMKFLQDRTTLPIPIVLDMEFNEEEDQAWFTMTHLPGKQLGEAWPLMSINSQQETLCQLKSFLGQVHSILPAQPSFIGSCSMGPAYCHRLNNMGTSGPFKTVSDFNDFLVDPVKKSPRPDWVPKYRCRLPDDTPVCFVHADLSWENILVEPSSGNVTAILDWEMAGYWPKWWEYRKGLYGGRGKPWWIEIMNQITQEYKSETLTDMDLEMY